jgi:Tol biopolymer transport system component
MLLTDRLNTNSAVPVGNIDIWQLALDGSGSSRRLSHFTQYAGYGANHPVVSPDGRKMAFALRLKCGGNGNGRGILLFDFEEAPHELFRASFGLGA